MAQTNSPGQQYFIFEFPLSVQAWQRFAIGDLFPAGRQTLLEDPIPAIRKLTDRHNRQVVAERAVPAEILLALRTVNRVLRWVTRHYFLEENPGSLARSRQWASTRLGHEELDRLDQVFVELFPPVAVSLDHWTAQDFLRSRSGSSSGTDQATLEMLLLFLNLGNPAARAAIDLYDDQDLRRRASFVPFVTTVEEYLDNQEPPGSLGVSLFRLLRSPMLACPDSLAGQLQYMREHWQNLLPTEFIRQLELALDLLKEADVWRSLDFGPPPVLEFGPGSSAYGKDGFEPEAFSRDADWMSNVVLMAKSVFVWLDQLSRSYERPIDTLADIPDEELDRLASWGVTGLWLIGIWQRSQASRLIKQYMGNPEAQASAYSLDQYRIADELGGDQAWRNLRDRAAERGIRLASDMVPNHMGIDSRWVREHPDWFLQAGHPPYPAYSYTGGDLCDQPGLAIRIEDGYWQHRDAAVVFQRVDEGSGDVRYIYHGNDGTSMPWNDTAQLNFLLPEVRESVIQVILEVARQFPIIRFDAAMTLAKKHFQRLWFPAPGDAGAIPSRAQHGMTQTEFDRVFPQEFWREVVDRVAAEVPDTLLLAEAFWLMEGYFVRTLGMHRVYNSAFMNMLKMEDNAKYRQTIKNVLEFSPEVLKRFVNFMNNPDEKTAVEQFGRGDKYFGCALLLVTMPGLPMLGHGQIEGFTEKYGMEYRRAYWDEQIDNELVQRHEREIFPLMRRRWLFSGAQNFVLFDFVTAGGTVDENVFAYTNRHGDQRALILYNNSYGSTSGWIKLSTAINTDSADQPRLVRRSLSEALDLSTDDGRWWIFRDHIDGLQYLRSATELSSQGFHSNLNGYQYRALVDFREVVDTDGLWGRLAERLAGSGAPDLDRARRRLEIEPVLNLIDRWCGPDTLARLEPPAPAEAGQDEPSPQEEPRRPEKPAPSDDSTNGLVNSLENDLAKTAAAIGEIFTLGPKHSGWDGVLADLPGSRITQAVYLRVIVNQLPQALPQEMAGISLTEDDWPLLLEEITRHFTDWTGHDYAGRSGVQMALALAAARPAIAALGNNPATDWFATLIALPPARTLLGLNQYEGAWYLVREGLESLLTGVSLCALVDQKTARKRANLLAGGEIPSACLDILNAAAEAGYRLDEILARLAHEKE